MQQVVLNVFSHFVLFFLLEEYVKGLSKSSVVQGFRG